MFYAVGYFSDLSDIARPEIRLLSFFGVDEHTVNIVQIYQAHDRQPHVERRAHRICDTEAAVVLSTYVQGSSKCKLLIKTLKSFGCAAVPC
jgi:hypothetical protein